MSFAYQFIPVDALSPGTDCYKVLNSHANSKINKYWLDSGSTPVLVTWIVFLTGLHPAIYIKSLRDFISVNEILGIELRLC